jgi:hypothetical protein
VERHLAEVGHLADVPEQPHVGGAGDAGADLGDVLQGAQGRHVVGLAGAHEVGVLARRLEAGEERLDRAEVEAAVAPLELAQRRERVASIASTTSASRPGTSPVTPKVPSVVKRPARPAIWASSFGVRWRWRRPSNLVTPEKATWAMSRLRPMPIASVATRWSTSPFWKSATWALRVRGRERAHHHRGAALLAADQLGDGVDVLDREADDGAARRQAADLARTGVGELREPLAAQEARLGHQARDAAAHGVGAEKERLLGAAGVQQPVGEDVAAVGVAGELDLVDREEVGQEVERHRLDGADPVGGAGGHDALLAGDQRDDGGAAERDDAVVDLAREQAQRQADDAGAVAEHALDGVVGLAGVGRAEHRADARVEVEGHAVLPRGRGVMGKAGGAGVRARRRRGSAPAARSRARPPAGAG